MRRSYLAIVLLTALIVTGVSFTSTPTINDDAETTTIDDLKCEWSASDTTTTNLTWLRDGTPQTNVTGATSPTLLDSSNTNRDEIWTCRITISNGTDVITEEDNATIANADPSPINVTDEGNTDIGTNETINEDASRTFTVESSDPDGDPVTYGYISPPGIPDNSDLDFNTGAFTWTPNASQVGNHNVTFTAEDDQSPDKGVTTKSVVFTVNPVNDAPVFDPALTDQTATEDQAFTYSITVTDEEDDTPINFSLTSGLNDLQITSTGASSADITFTGGSPDFEDGGNYTVNVTINDSRGASNTESFNLEVETTNQLPNLSVPNASGSQGQPFNVTFNATDKNTNDTITYSVTAVSCPVTNPWSVSKLNQTDRANDTIAYGWINTTLTNDHVACPNVEITADDGKETVTVQRSFNITNVNDAPVFSQNSADSTNTGNDNVTNQTAFANAAYRYTVNVSDIDSITPGGENLTYTDNTSLFEISDTGVISFTPNSSDIGNYSVLLNASDDGGLSDTAVMNLSIKANSAPQFDNLTNVTCQEDQLCTVFFDATDADGDTITFASNDTAFPITDYNATTGVLNETYNQSFVGNYSLTVNVTDIRGATTSRTVAASVINTNDEPVLDPVLFPEPIVATKSFRIDLTASDEDIDLLGAAEQLNYTASFINGTRLFNVTTSFDNETNTSTGLIEFTPGDNETGDYRVNLSVEDPGGAADYQVVNFTVLNDTAPPNITQIRPYGEPIANATVFNFTNTSQFPANETTINVSENTTVTFNHSTTDDTTALTNLSYTWYENGSEVATSLAYIRTFDFFSQRSYNITLMVEDDRLENATWTWNVDVADVNRAPELLHPLENVSIAGAETFSNYLYLRSNVKYLDPDDDVDGSGTINDSETNRLSFSAGSCGVADIQIDGTDVKFVGDSIGTCTTTFTATDPAGASLVSNNVTVNVTEIVEETETTTVTESSGGGGGGSSSVVIPQEEEVPTPEPVNIVTPTEVTIYRNQTATVDIVVANTWNGSLSNITLGASTNRSGVNMTFSQDRIESLDQGENTTVSMTVAGYRLGSNFEVVVNGSVSEPAFTDSASVLFNSIEAVQSEDAGQNAEVLVTFARDLLGTNEECQELEELLDRARETDDGEEKVELLNTVIDGCKYLISNTQVEEEQPARFNIDFINRFSWFYAGIGVLLLGMVVAIVMIEYNIRKNR